MQEEMWTYVVVLLFQAVAVVTVATWRLADLGWMATRLRPCCFAIFGCLAITALVSIGLGFTHCISLGITMSIASVAATLDLRRDSHSRAF